MRFKKGDNHIQIYKYPQKWINFNFIKNEKQLQPL